MLHIENQDYNRDQFGFYSLDDLVPQDHLLRQIEEAIDFSFIYDLVADSISRDVCLHSEQFSMKTVFNYSQLPQYTNQSTLLSAQLD